MDSEPRGPEKTIPSRMQARLRGIYETVPSRETRLARLFSEEKQPTGSIDIEGLGSGLYDMLNKPAGEVGETLIKEAREIVGKAAITDFSKEEILDGLEFNFRVGRKPNDTSSIFPSIGVTEENAMEEGIFSTDPNVRMEIERAIYNKRKETVERMRNKARELIEMNSGLPYEKQNAMEYAEHGRELEERIRQMEEQFLALYGESINNGS